MALKYKLAAPFESISGVVSKKRFADGHVESVIATKKGTLYTRKWYPKRTNNITITGPSPESNPKGAGGILYDVPWLVRDPNEYRMSEKRHQIEVRNQAVVDDYFIARDKGASAHEAREVVATKHGIKPKSVRHALDWFFHEAKKRRKYDFLQKFSHEMEH